MGEINTVDLWELCAVSVSTTKTGNRMCLLDLALSYQLPLSKSFYSRPVLMLQEWKETGQDFWTQVEEQGGMPSGGQEVGMTMEGSTGICKRGLTQAVLKGMDCSVLVRVVRLWS